MEVQFDPGFIKHISAFVPNIEYVYSSFSQFKIFNQKKMQFKMFYPKIQGLLKNYIGFYLGCILWAIYIKQFKNAEILNNLCYGGDYNEAESLGEVDFIKQYVEQLKKDAKYYVGQEFSLDDVSMNIIDTYREFLKINEGFVKTKTTDDVKIPSCLKSLSQKDLQEIETAINEVVENGNLYELTKLAQKVL